MIAISSFRPLKDCSPDIARNQIRAKESWNSVFDMVIYFGDPEPLLASDNTVFVPCEPFPRINVMVLYAVLAKDFACLINADIVVMESLRNVPYSGRLVALTSRRYEFDPQHPRFAEAKIVDNGADIFGATPGVWRKCLGIIPEDWRIGHGGWDSWMLGFLQIECGRRFMDITRQKCIFHPRHAERKPIYNIQVENSMYAVHSGFPTPY